MLMSYYISYNNVFVSDNSSRKGRNSCKQIETNETKFTYSSLTPCVNYTFSVTGQNDGKTKDDDKLKGNTTSIITSTIDNSMGVIVCHFNEVISMIILFVLLVSYTS